MRKLLLAAVMAVAGVMLTSCYSRIDFEGLLPEPVPVINAVASPGNVVRASISRTYSVEENTADLYIRDADVTLTVNGSYTEQMTKVEFDTLINYGGEPWHVVTYVSTYRPQVGDRIEISASTPYGEAHCSDEIPVPVAIRGVQTTLEPAEGYGSYQSNIYDVTYHVKFSDPAGVPNYYLVNVSAKDFWASGSVGYIEYIDPVFEMQNRDITEIGSENSMRNGWGWTFSDETIDGQDYSLTLKETGVALSKNSTNPWQRQRSVRLYSLSESYYKYLRSVLKSDQREESSIGDIGILEPVAIFSNVDGGTGVFGAMGMTEMSFNIKLP